MFFFFYALLLSISCFPSNAVNENFLQCLSVQSSQTILPVYTPINTSFSSVLETSAKNLRFLSPTTPKPRLIITPLEEAHVQAAVLCCRQHGLQMRVRSGGHDYEGLSYVSHVPFVIVDLINFRSVNVDLEGGTAWIEAGITIGEAFYRIAQKSPTLAIPAALCPTVGAGGQFSGGGYGSLMRKYGLAGDNIVDARLVNAKGEILNRESMGEDLFWAIRGGGGGSFGVILSWKIKLVPVPATVTGFTVARTLEQNATALIYRWQSFAAKVHEDLFMRVIISKAGGSDGKQTILALFQTLFLGGTERLLPIMKESFPELGLKPEECTEMSWLQSVAYVANLPTNGSVDVLLDRNLPSKSKFKAKSDYVTEPIPETGLQGIWERFFEVDSPLMIFTPYGGKMNEFSESAIPFPYRAGTIYKIQHLVSWTGGVAESRKHRDWISKLYSYMTPYVSKSPRGAYVNYRDLDLGQTKADMNSTQSYLRAKVWGTKYFKKNFDRLVQVKTKFDPENFFRHEQSIPVLPS
ncbi:hypothetical protein Sjap_024697 [Stephania japonica]|uniref:FAD-binding PCMH-type domain-containing protein n=1 Tax=Stephania japonica TaxID=461633 RepID=A0AAP0EG17_9MAGN